MKGQQGSHYYCHNKSTDDTSTEVESRLFNNVFFFCVATAHGF
jgi:hypothetical protein